jgi:hypothetical protein
MLNSLTSEKIYDISNDNVVVNVVVNVVITIIMDFEDNAWLH